MISHNKCNSLRQN